MGNGVLQSTLFITILGLVSKVLGFIRETLIAAKFGSGGTTDAFFIAFTATGLFAGLINNSVSTTAIPVINKIKNNEDEGRHIDYINNLINIFGLLAIIFSVIGIIFAPQIVYLLAKGLDEKYYNLAISLTRIGFPIMIFTAVRGILSAYLTSEHKHRANALIGLPFNFIYISYLLLLSSKYGIKGLMVAAILAVVSQVLILLPEIKRTGFKYEFILDFKDKYLKQTLILSIPVLIGVAVNDINAIIDRRLASSLAIGSVSSLNYANKLTGLISGVFISAMTTVIYPILSEKVGKNDMEGLKDSMRIGINFILMLTIPAAVGMMVLSKPIIEIAFERGAFDATATSMTASALIAYAVGLIGTSLRMLVTRVYYSLQDTSTPMKNGVLAVIMNIILNFIFMKYLGHAGLALATSISTTVATFILIVSLRKKLGPMGGKKYLETGIKVTIASVIMGFIARYSYNYIYHILSGRKIYNFISLIAAVIIGVIVYGVICYLLDLEEIKLGVKKIKEFRNK